MIIKNPFISSISRFTNWILKDFPDIVIEAREIYNGTLWSDGYNRYSFSHNEFNFSIVQFNNAILVSINEIENVRYDSLDNFHTSTDFINTCIGSYYEKSNPILREIHEEDVKFIFQDVMDSGGKNFKYYNGQIELETEFWQFDFSTRSKFYDSLGKAINQLRFLYPVEVSIQENMQFWKIKLT